MCGIVGVVNLDQKLVDEDLIARMADSLSHRGPDGKGSWIDGSVGLEHASNGSNEVWALSSII